MREDGASFVYTQFIADDVSYGLSIASIKYYRIKDHPCDEVCMKKPYTNMPLVSIQINFAKFSFPQAIPYYNRLEA